MAEQKTQDQQKESPLRTERGGISGPAAALGRRENVCLELSQPKDEQGLRATSCYE